MLEEDLAYPSQDVQIPPDHRIIEQVEIFFRVADRDL